MAKFVEGARAPANALVARHRLGQGVVNSRLRMTLGEAAAQAIKEEIDNRSCEKGQSLRDNEAANDGDAERSTELAAGPGAKG